MFRLHPEIDEVWFYNRMQKCLNAKITVEPKFIMLKKAALPVRKSIQNKMKSPALLKLALIIVCLSQPGISLHAQDKMQWFNEAKLGIFIHWGIYSVNGIDESWSFYNNYISHGDYMKQLRGFTASDYDPEEWAGLIKESGAKYAVITTRHHDGVALWDTKFGNLNVVHHTPAKRDLIAPFAAALRKEDLKVGLYYSHSDWSHPDYDHFRSDSLRYKDDPERWQRFLDYRRGQIKELNSRFKPDLFWFDGDWEHSAEDWQSKQIREMILAKNQQVIINSRLSGYGDYATPEQGVPITPPRGSWELCMTMNDSWGYQGNDQNYKTPYQVIRIFADVVGMGGNLLLDIGPKADGTIPEEQRRLLSELGKWTRKHAEAIYGTVAGMPPGYFYGPTSLSADRQTLYLFLPHKPNGPVVVKGLKNQINRIRIVGDGTKLTWKVMMKQYWSAIPGILYIDVPVDKSDQYMTVIAVQLKGTIDFYLENRDEQDGN